MNIRYSTNLDCEQIYNLHRASIIFYCSPFYSKEAIDSWVGLKSSKDYVISSNTILIVAEEHHVIYGFCLLNKLTKNIEGLYIKPHYSGKGIGKSLLLKIESLAINEHLDSLTLYSTINATEFYRRQGYGDELQSLFNLSSGIDLSCVRMTKDLLTT